MKTIYRIIFLICFLPFILFSQNYGTVIPTNEWVSIWGDSIMNSGIPIKIGSIVRAFDPKGILCGEFIVKEKGKFGLMSVYKDDPTTQIDEGAVVGDTIKFTINDTSAIVLGPGIPVWKFNGSVVKLNLKIGKDPQKPIAPIAIDVKSILSNEFVAGWYNVSGAEGYLLDVARDNSFTDYVTGYQNKNVSMETSWLVKGLLPNSIYYYRVKAFNFAGIGLSSNVIKVITRNAITPTNEWVSFWGDSLRINGCLINIGSIIRAYDPQGTFCGEFKVKEFGKFGLMPVYRDDGLTTYDEGANPGDAIRFTINDSVAIVIGPGLPVWSSSGSVIKINLRIGQDNIIKSTTAYNAFNISTDKFSVKWNNIDGVCSYALDVARDSMFNDYLIGYKKRDVGNTNSYSVKDVIPGTTYYFRVRGMNSLGEGPTSNIVKVITKQPFIFTNEWVSLWGDNISIYGKPVRVGSLIRAFDPQGILCGEFEVHTTGIFGLMSVYKDDSFTTLDEGASPGDTLRLTINDTTAFVAGPNLPIWLSNGTIIKINMNIGTIVNAPILSAPSSNAISRPINDTLKWSNVTAATSYQMQISVGSSFTTTIKDITQSDTKYYVTGLSNNTKYYWRVRGMNIGGGGPYSVDSFTTIITAPSIAPNLIYPTNGVTGIHLNLLFKWNNVPTALNYRLNVSTDNTFTTMLKDTTTTDTTYRSYNLASGTKYYWRVLAANDVGSGPYSGVRDFTVGTNIVVAPTIAPVLLSPSSNGINRPINDTLKWSSVTAATSYELQISTMNNFIITMLITQSDTKYYVTGLLNDTKYYWRVRGSNEGGSGPYSVDSFTTVIAAPTATPILSAPSSNAISRPINDTLKWSNVTAATSYQMQISVGSSFTTTIKDITQSDTKYYVTGLSNNTKYYWRVRGMNIGGGGPYSVDSFTTIITAPSIAAVLLSPTSNAFNRPVNDTLKWQNVERAIGYQLQLLIIREYILTVQDTVISATNYFVKNLRNNTKYFWRVRGLNVAGNGPYCEFDSFTTVKLSYKMTASKVGNGKITPDGDTLVTEFDSLKYVMQADAGYHIKYVYIDSVQVWGGGSSSSTTHIFRNIDRPHSIKVVFRGEPKLNIITKKIDFGLVKQTSFKDTVFVIRNDGNDTLRLRLYSPSTIFTITNPNLIRNIIQSSEIKEPIRITPNLLIMGSISGMLYVESNHLNQTKVDSIELVASVVTKVTFGVEIPKNYSITQNYPNPFNPTTTIRFGLPNESYVTLEIYNSLGQLVQTLVNEVMSAHYYEVKWEAGKNPTGLYFYKIIATDINNPNNKLIQTKKMMLVK